MLQSRNCRSFTMKILQYSNRCALTALTTCLLVFMVYKVYYENAKSGYLLRFKDMFLEKLENAVTERLKTSCNNGNNVAKANHTTSLVTRSLKCKPGLYLLVLVTSHAWYGFDRRITIRETWGKYDGRIMGKNGPTWQTFFLVGSHWEEKTDDWYKSKAHAASLRTEMENYQDIITGDFNETFYNLPRKLQMAFEWAEHYCDFQFLYKTDDDVFTHMKKMINLLTSLRITEMYTGRVVGKARVQRGGKYATTSEEYNGTHYPPYVSGATMIFSSDVVSKLVSAFPNVKVFKHDDVYIGMVADSLNISTTDVDPGDKKLYWDVWRSKESREHCGWYKEAIVRAVYFGKIDKRWCIHKMYQELTVADRDIMFEDP